MAVRLKKLSDQVIVITGASSGIGLTTARAAAEKGAKLVLVSRDQQALDALVAELKVHGGQSIAVAADVGIPEDVTRVGQAAIDHFGRIDTWVNNAGISIYGRMEEVSLADEHRLFQTNFWGVVHGSLEAAKRMKQQGGGAIINMGSEASDRAMPLQGMYSASKHAVKGFTDSLRVELEEQGAPISVTLIKPASIDTMFPVHSKNYMEVEPTLPPPVYAPDLVAGAVLYAAQHPKRDVFVGGAAKAMSLGGYHVPGMIDRVMRKTMFSLQKSSKPTPAGRTDSLYASDPSHELRERDGVSAHVIETCPYTAISLRSKQVTMGLLGGGALWAAWRLTRAAAR
jgi:short-subunit dehydrogenase